MKKVACYVRVSTQEQVNGYSIPEQIERLTKYCEAHGWVLVETYVDPGYSGTNTERPGIQKLIHDIPKGSFDTVLVYKLDRLSRSQKDTMELIEDVFLANDIDFISVNENFDTGTPFGRAMIGILSVFAQLERDQIRERLMMGKIGRAKSGKWAGGYKPPIGYDYKDDRLIVNDYEAMQIRKVFDLFLNGLDGEELSLRQIRIYMEQRYKTRYSSWSHPTAISRVLKNRTYIGEISYSGEWYQGEHEAIIDMDTWNAAQKKYETYIKQFSKSQQHPFEGRNLLTGMLYCSHCGARYYIQSTTDKRTPGTVRRYKFYACYSKSGSKKMIKMKGCPSRRIKKEVLDQQIIDEIKKLSLDPEKINRLQAASIPEKTNDAEIIKQRIASIDSQVDKLLDLYQIGRLDVSKLSARVDALNEEKENLLAELENKKKPLPLMDAEEARRLVANCDDVFRDGTPEEQQALVRSLIKKIVIYDEDIEIHWSFCVEKNVL